MFSCAIDPARRRVIATTRLHGPRGFADVNLLVDTGTSVTIIDGEVVHDLGYSPRDGRGPSRLLGPDEAGSLGWILTIGAIEVFGVRHEPFRVHVHDMPREDGIDGLLGMDWLIGHVMMLDGPGGAMGLVR